GERERGGGGRGGREGDGGTGRTRRTRRTRTRRTRRRARTRAETTDGGAGARGVEGAATRQDQAARRRGPATGAAPVLGTALAVVASDTYAERSTPFPSSMTASSA
ncbi:unnamed protein product, partial [Prorocentrum cordatum]